MKMTKILALVLALVMATACFTACPTNKEPDFTVWVSELDGSVALAEKQIAAFQEMMGTNYYIKVEGQTEADAGSKVVADVATAPDVYCFAQDQLARLVQAAALAQPGKAASATIKANNDAGSVSAASNAGELYAYPMTSDNGYYLYYDKSVVTNPESLEDIIADCVAGGKLFRYALENAWYTASFFFAVDCHSNWTMDENGEFVAVDDNFNSDAGFIAMKGMQKLAQSTCYDSNADIFTDAAAIVTGIWNANAAAEHFGDNLGVTDLPSFTVDGKSYHLGSYAGYKLMGVKPQATDERAEFCEELALYLTNAQSQLDRYNLLQWGPSNLEAQNNEAVKANSSLKALQLQNEYSTVQGQIHGSWWDIAKVLGAEAKDTTDEELREALAAYQASIDAILNMDEGEKKAWFVIGSMGNSNWETDLPMTEVESGVWESNEYIAFVNPVYTEDANGNKVLVSAGTEFVCRRGHDWNYKVAAEGAIRWDGSADLPNITFESFSLTDGNYKVRFTWDGDPTHNATVELVPEA
ncbi:MAG: extracellular solute-binding protein [Clostridia bacterium]|nr:extracellular solute-binding protein [Clostridia bacterium]